MASSEDIERLRRQISAIENAKPTQGKRFEKRAEEEHPSSVERLQGDQNSSRGDNGESKETQALNKIIRLVNVSERSEAQIRDRLLRDGFSEEVCDDAIAKAVSYGLVDNDRFARMLIRTRLAQGSGLPGIERELVRNEIDPENVPGWPEEFLGDSEDDVERALQLLEKKPPRSKNIRSAAYRRLIQKGYSSSVASSAARIYAEREGSSQEVRGS